ncbi:MAG: addiction module protein [Verrucomicrobiae bacterium]|nr:addiction module protein [Verrucomicrobiae bacterium]
MPRTVEQIVEESRDWAQEPRIQLADRLGERLHAVDPEIEAAWKAEVERRLEELRSGQVQPIPETKSPPGSAQSRVGEAPRLSPRR